MRPFEIVIPILLAGYLIWTPTLPPAIRFLPIIAFAITLIHFEVEGYRWQMIPLYALTLILAIISQIGVKGSRETESADSFLTHRLAQGGAVILLAVSTALPILLPVPSVESPSGPYKVGTTTFELTDSSRREIYSGRDEPRRFQIQVWYPSYPKPGDPHAPWMDRADIFGHAISKFLKLPGFFLDHLKLVKTPAYVKSPIAKSNEQYPIILFSHGWKGFAAQNTGQAIELASQGYVVVAVQHTYGAIVTVFDDGTIAPNNPDALPSDVSEDMYDTAARKLADQWSGDLSFALSFMIHQNNDSGSMFYSTLDVNRVGVYGHSMGGGAAIQFCGVDPRCKALLGMDPFMTPVSLEVLNNGASQPSFFMFSQGWYGDRDSRNNQLFDAYYSRGTDNLGVIGIEGAKHYDFSDLPMLSPIAPQLGLKGPINGQKMVKITDTYLLEFFNATLKEKDSGLFNHVSGEFPEVKLLRLGR